MKRAALLAVLVVALTSSLSSCTKFGAASRTNTPPAQEQRTPSGTEDSINIPGPPLRREINSLPNQPV